MDLSFSEQDRAFQAEVRNFLDEAWPQEMRDKQSRSALGKLSKDDLVGWQKRLATKGWAATNWPKEYGGCEWDAVQHQYRGEPLLLLAGLDVRRAAELIFDVS